MKTVDYNQEDMIYQTYKDEPTKSKVYRWEYIFYCCWGSMNHKFDKIHSRIHQIGPSLRYQPLGP